MTPPIYIEVDAQTILDEMVASYEGLTGNTLQPAQPERLILSTWAYRESLLRSRVQAAAQQNLISFSTEPVLDYLGEFFDALRNDAQNAVTTIEFTLQAGHGGVTIPEGTRIASTDGLAVFKTQGDIIVPAVDLTATAVCVSVTEGANFNDYAIGLISEILDPQPWLVSATNTDITAGGSDRETDDQYRERIRLAADAFGTAGSTNAYKFFSFSANPLIVDVSVHRPVAGTVEIFPLVSGGQVTPQLILDQVEAICNAEDNRPLTDTVIVTAPTQVSYTIDVDITVYNSADPTDVEANVQAALDAWVVQQGSQMGTDIMVDQITAQCMVDGVYDIDLGGMGDIIVAINEYAWCSAVNVTVVGSNEG